MKKIINLCFILLSVLAILILLPTICSAATATDEESLNSVIQSADSGSTIEIQNNITITKPIAIAKELIIDGNGYTIAGSTEWTSITGNQTMFTAQSSKAKLTLKNINLNNGPKYGVQSYDGATVILDNVSITGFRYGGVLVNGGNVEIIDLHLGYNGTGANNGIEIDKGAAAKNNPTLIMNGTLTSDSKENVVRAAENGYLTEFTITNTENTTNKVVIAGDKVVLTDENNNVISESKIPDKATANTDETSKKVIITLIWNNNETKITFDEGGLITKDILKSYINLDSDYKIDGFYLDKEFTKEFNFDEELSKDLSIYTKISKIENSDNIEDEDIKEEIEEEKDDVPKTGVESYLGLAIFSILLSTIGIVYINKKNEK